MASSERNIQLRYIILDACFAQSAREESVFWTKEALLEEVNRQLLEAHPFTKPIAMRTLEKDIVDMKAIYGVHIESGRRGGKVHYAYADNSDGINKSQLIDNELLIVHQFIQIMDRFRGIPGWDWWLRSKLIMQAQMGMIGSGLSEREWKPRIMEITFSKDERRWYESLVEAAFKQTALRLVYAPGMGDQLERVDYLPDQLVQQPVGVFALGSAWDPDIDAFFHLVVKLDEITSLDTVVSDWPEGLKPRPFNWEVYAADRMALTPGVVSASSDVTISVRVWVADQLAQQFLKEPMHGSQDLRVEQSGGGIIFTLYLVPDIQFVRFALQWGDEFQVLEPEDVRHKLRLASRSASDRYAPMFGP